MLVQALVIPVGIPQQERKMIANAMTMTHPTPSVLDE
jgi:hypothetical protein